MADRSAASLELPAGSLAAFCNASRCSGTLVGEVIVAAAPGTKLSPVITPPVLTVTSAVACCHHGFLTERTGTTSPLRRLHSRRLARFGFSGSLAVAGLLAWPG